LGGFLLSVATDLPSGAVIVLVSSVLLAGAAVVGRGTAARQRAGGRRLAGKSHEKSGALRETAVFSAGLGSPALRQAGMPAATSPLTARGVCLGLTAELNAMKKEFVTRFSVSLPPTLLNQLDRMTREKSYDNRSLAIADMIRAQLVEHQQERGDVEIVGTITLVYDHHRMHVQETLTDIQHDHHDVILSTVHVHLDHHNCLEVLIVKGQAAVVKKIADELIAAKGVKHGKLTVTTTGKNLPS
jgi:CopG family transcriptional regulator, nickel-responsive regulator